MKTLNLYKNEITKASRKAAYIVLVCLTLVSVLGAGTLFKIVDVLSNVNYYYDDWNNEWREEQKKEILESEQQNLEIAKKLISAATTPEEMCDGVIKYYYSSLNCNEFLAGEEFKYSTIGYYIPGYTEAPDYIGESVIEIVRIRSCRATVNVISETTGAAREESEAMLSDYLGYQVANYDEATEKMLVDLVKNEDFTKYVDWKIEEVNNNSALSAQSKSIQIEGYETLRRAFSKDLTDTQWAELKNGIQTLSDYRVMISERKDFEGNLLTDEEVHRYELAADEVELSVAMRTVGYGGNVTEEKSYYAKYTVDFGINIATVFLILIGTLLVAEEIQTGSIKTLIIAPVKRHRIFTAKLLTLVTVALMEIAIIFVTFTLVNLIYNFGSANVVFTFLGKARSLNYYVYYFIYIVLAMVKAFVFGLFSLMLSTTMRNVAAVLSISLVMTFVVDSVVSAMAAIFTPQVPAMVMRFLPSTNLNLNAKVFMHYSTSALEGISDLFFEAGVNPQPWYFSAIYVAVFTFLLIFISYQSFEKRDIK